MHRDVAPDNILMLYDRAGGNDLEQAPRPVLLDFGAARRLVADATQNLTSLLKSGCSPVEQYDDESRLLQGPWSDVYALSAGLNTAAIGRVPKAAIARLLCDDLVSARVAGKGRYSQSFLAAIDAGLAVRPEQRPQSMAALRECFNRPEPPGARPHRANPRSDCARRGGGPAAEAPCSTYPRHALVVRGCGGGGGCTGPGVVRPALGLALTFKRC